MTTPLLRWGLRLAGVGVSSTVAYWHFFYHNEQEVYQAKEPLKRPLKQVLIDGKLFFYAEGDLSPDAEQTFDALQRKNALPQGSSNPLVLDTSKPPLDIDAESWHELLEREKTHLDRLRASTVVIDARRFSSRLPSAIKEQLKGVEKIRALARSAAHVGFDDQNRNNEIGLRLALAYGIDEKNIQPVYYEESRNTSLDECLPLHAWVNSGPAEGTIAFNRTILTDNQGNPDVAIDYCRITQEISPMYLTSANAFMKKQDRQIREATGILKTHHRDLSGNNLYLAYTELNFFELDVYNETDALQDIAASGYAASPQYGDIVKYLSNGSLKSRIATSRLGSVAWRLYSRFEKVPIATQGLGPLQIIPELARAAFEEPGLFEDYRTQTALSDDDFKDRQSLIRALFDPDKMFAIKAMTWDLQLRQMKQVQNLTLPYTAPPHLNSRSASGELAILIGARTLVITPDQNGPVISWLLHNTNAAAYMSRLHLMGDIVGVTPEIEGITTVKMDPCPPSAFGYYLKGRELEKTCLFSD